MAAQVWLVIPTYNEAENVEGIVRAAADELAQVVPGDFQILIVDDGSPDGTGQIADSLAAELPAVEVLHRNAKGGLGHAYLAGFARALEGGAQILRVTVVVLAHGCSHADVQNMARGGQRSQCAKSPHGGHVVMQRRIARKRRADVH